MPDVKGRENPTLICGPGELTRITEITYVIRQFNASQQQTPDSPKKYKLSATDSKLFRQGDYVYKVLGLNHYFDAQFVQF